MYVVVHYGPSMMSKERGVFLGERCLGNTPQTPLNSHQGQNVEKSLIRGLSKGYFPGSSLTVLVNVLKKRAKVSNIIRIQRRQLVYVSEIGAVYWFFQLKGLVFLNNILNGIFNCQKIFCNLHCELLKCLHKDQNMIPKSLTVSQIRPPLSFEKNKVKLNDKNQ